MLQALETARNLLDLPAFVRADFFSLLPTAGTSAFGFAQLIDMRRDRKILEAGQIATAFPSLNTSLGRSCRRLGIHSGDRLLVQLFGKLQQQLRQLARRAQPVRSWAVEQS